MKFRPIKKEQIDEILKLQDIIVEELEDKTFYETSSKDFIEKVYDTGGFIIGAYDEKKLIGVAGAKGPEEGDNYGQYAGLKGEEAEYIYYFDFAFVHPDYRGKNLQRLMLIELQNFIENKTNKKYIMGTVHPYNYGSLSSLFKMGFQLFHLMDLYGGKRRFIAIKYLREKCSYDDKILVKFNNEERFMELFKQGYSVIGLERDKGFIFTIVKRERNDGISKSIIK